MLQPRASIRILAAEHTHAGFDSIIRSDVKCPSRTSDGKDCFIPVAVVQSVAFNSHARPNSIWLTSPTVSQSQSQPISIIGPPCELLRSPHHPSAVGTFTGHSLLPCLARGNNFVVFLLLAMFACSRLSDSAFPCNLLLLILLLLQLRPSSRETMDRIVGGLKQPAGRHGGQNQHKKMSATGIPAIQITQMTLDEGEGAEEQGAEEGKCQPKERTEPPTECTSVDAKSPVSRTEGGGQLGTAASLDKEQQPDNALLSANKYQDRGAVSRQSTGTLNRLILVAQALENEVDWRRRNDVNSSRIVFTLRMANIVLLLLVNLLLFTGVGQYHDRNGARISLFLTLDKWYYRPGYPADEVPPTFSDMRLTGQFCAAGLAVAMLLSTVLLQCIHCLRVQHHKLLCIFYAFGCVPVALFIFGLEMHYSACPWLDDFYQSQLLRRNFHSMEKFFDTQCGINGWALAGIFSLLSCGLFVSDGLISAFFRADDSHTEEKAEAV